MNKSFSINSTHSDRKLSFSNFDGENFRVELNGGINAAIRVYGYAPHAHDLAHWFNEFGRHESPWQGELCWESLEGEFKITAKCTSLGQVYINVALRDMPGAHEESYIEAGIETELGQLINISNEARKFFAK